MLGCLGCVVLVGYIGTTWCLCVYFYSLLWCAFSAARWVVSLDGLVFCVLVDWFYLCGFGTFWGAVIMVV